MPRSSRSSRFRGTSRRRVRVVLGAALGAALLAACSSTVDGHPVSANSPTAVHSGPSGATASAPSDTGLPGASGASAPAPASSPASGTFVCAGNSPAPIVTCLQGSLGDFWSGMLNESITQPVVLAPGPSQVPADCRGGLDLGTAFTCSSNRTLYVTAKFLTLLTDEFADDLGYALAALQSHEMGHAVQYAVHQPSVEVQNPTAAQSREFEQQADCLAGVWAHRVAADGGLNAAHFVSVDFELISMISSNPEIATHGTPLQRRAAVDRGLDSGRPQACKLATFH